MNKFFKESDFVKNIVIIMTGTGLSQLFVILLTPIQTRNYSVEDFGLFTIYLSVFLVINTISTGKFERVIFLVSDINQIKIASVLSLFFSFIISGLLFLVMIIFSKSNLFQINETLKFWLYTVPLLTIITAANLIMVTYLNKQKKYKIISVSRIIKTTFSLTLSLLFVLQIKNSGGLIISEIFGYLLSTIYLHFHCKGLFNLENFKNSQFLTFIKKYREFPLYNIPADFLNISSAQLPVFFLTTYFGSKHAGFFSLMKRVLDAPVNLLSSSILEVFRQNAAEQLINFGNCRKLFIETAKKLALVSFIPFVVLFTFGPYLFTAYLGEEWRFAGLYGRIFSIYYFFKFISSPLSYMFILAEKQRIDFLLHIYIFLSTIIILNLPYFLNVDSEFILYCYSINFSIIYVVYFKFSYNFTLITKSN